MCLHLRPRSCGARDPPVEARGIAQQGRAPGDGAGGRGENEGAHALRPRQRVLQAAPAAHRLGHQSDLAEPEMVDQRRQISRIVGRIRPAGNFARRRKAAVGEGHAGTAAGEVRHLLPPAQVIAAEPVREHDRRPSAGDLVEEAAPRPVDGPAFGLRAGLGRHDFHTRTLNARKYHECNALKTNSTSP